MSTTIEAIKQAIDSAQNIIVFTHIGPDGDALGSLTATGVALQLLGKDVTLVCDDSLVSRFQFLPLIDNVQKSPGSQSSYDLVIVVDCGDRKRMGGAFAALPASHGPIINIDHHITNTRFGDINLVVPTATSTTEILYQLFCQMGLPLTAELATSLLTGLVTDTLGFRTDNVSAQTLKIASELVEAGANLSLITAQTLNLKPLSTLLLWRIGLNKMNIEDGLVWASISSEERQAIGHTGDSSGGLVNLFADIDRAAMGVVLLEMENGTVRVGFRCRPPYDVSVVATALGGGGHPLAAGCTLEGPLAKAEARVVSLCKQAICEQTVQEKVLPQS